MDRRRNDQCKDAPVGEHARTGRVCSYFVTAWPAILCGVAPKSVTATVAAYVLVRARAHQATRFYRRWIGMFLANGSGMTTNTRLRHIAASKGWSLAELSRRSNVSATIVYGCANGQIPGPASRQRLEYALGVTSGELWGIEHAEGPHV